MSDTCSLAVIGDGAVGKSSIIAAFKSDGFMPVYKQVSIMSKYFVFVSIFILQFTITLSILCFYVDNRM